MQNTIIYLIGFAGVGKYTIAKELAKTENFKIIHNHLVNDVIFSVVQINDNFVSDYVWSQIEKIRNILFETVEKYSQENESFIFTNELIEGSKEDFEIYKKVENVANSRNSDFYPIRLILDEAEHKKRIVSSDRKLSKKISDIYYIEEIKGKDTLRLENTNLIEINISNLSAVNAAKEIIKKIKEKKCQ